MIARIPAAPYPVTDSETLMPKMTLRQKSLVHYAQAVAEWRAKGWSAASVNHMLVSALALTPSVHANPGADAVIVLEIADGVRCA